MFWPVTLPSHPWGWEGPPITESQLHWGSGPSTAPALQDFSEQAPFVWHPSPSWYSIALLAWLHGIRKCGVWPGTSDSSTRGFCRGGIPVVLRQDEWTRSWGPGNPYRSLECWSWKFQACKCRSFTLLNKQVKQSALDRPLFTVIFHLWTIRSVCPRQVSLYSHSHLWTIKSNSVPDRSVFPVISTSEQSSQTVCPRQVSFYRYSARLGFWRCPKPHNGFSEDTEGTLEVCDTSPSRLFVPKTLAYIARSLCIWRLLHSPPPVGFGRPIIMYVCQNCPV